MKTKKLLVIPLLLASLSGCSLAKGLEDNVNVVFEYKGEIISSDTVNQFKNILAPNLTDAQIPVNCEFFGWTWYNPNAVDITAENFDEKYIEPDGLVRYDILKDYVEGETITLRPLFFNEADIPVPEYYIAIGWYAKTSTSGLSEEKINAWVEDLKAFLLTQGATQEDLNNIKITPYVGDVATSGSQVSKDRYNDILLGWGGNLTSTGGVTTLDHIGGINMGDKSRYISRLTDKEIAVKVFQWLQTDEGNQAFR